MANGRPSDDVESPVVPANGGAGFGPGAPPFNAAADEVYNRVLSSDIGINTLLARLKQSIASAKDFAAFLHKRAQIEEAHASGLKKACRSTFEQARRPESRQGTYLQNYEALTRAHEKMADNGLSFAMSLSQMQDDLLELAREKEAGRKQWKQTGLAAEKRSQDAESSMDKAKGKYHSLAESLHGIKTGDKSGGRLGIKGVKNAAQVEEDTLRKMQAADADYQQKVQTARSYRKELVEQLRPQAARALEQLVNETDSALTLQIQKFATFNEKLLLSNGLCVSPLDEAPGKDRSLRQIVQSIDNTLDLRGFVTSFAARATSAPEPNYERHPTQGGGGGPPPSAQKPGPSPGPPQIASQGFSQQQQQQPPPSQAPPYQSSPASQPPHHQQPPRTSDQFSPIQDNGPPQIPGPSSPRGGNFPTSLDSGPPPQGTYSNPSTIQAVNAPPPYLQHPGARESPTPSDPRSPSNNQYGSIGQQQSTMPEKYSPAGAAGGGGYGGSGSPSPASRPGPNAQFGLSLQELMERDGTPVPTVVEQCLQAVNLFGLDVEGIYRVSGNGEHIKRLKEQFDKGIPLDFRNPETFHHDVNSVAGLLKQFFRDLPDPLMTRAQYRAFVEAARIDDETGRRDSVHAAINELPDPNYATLRSLVLHLQRVQDHEKSNKMNAGNLAICFGPTLMVAQNMQNIADAGWQVRTVDTILQHTLQIFDED